MAQPGDGSLRQWSCTPRRGATSYEADATTYYDNEAINLGHSASRSKFDSLNPDNDIAKRHGRSESDSNPADVRTSSKPIRDPRRSRQSSAASYRPTTAGGRRRLQDPLTPGRQVSDSNTIYAGSSFHASPAASALPLPSMLARASPPQPPTDRVRSAPALEHPQLENGSSRPFPIPQWAPVPSPRPDQRQDESPLEFLFQAKREEKARASPLQQDNRRGSVSRSPLSFQPHLSPPSAIPYDDEDDITSSPLRNRSGAPGRVDPSSWSPDAGDVDELDEGEELGSQSLKALLFSGSKSAQSLQSYKSREGARERKSSIGPSVRSTTNSPYHLRQPSKLKDELTPPSAERALSAVPPSHPRHSHNSAIRGSVQYHQVIGSAAADPFAAPSVPAEPLAGSRGADANVKSMEDDLRRILRLN